MHHSLTNAIAHLRGGGQVSAAMRTRLADELNVYANLLQQAADKYREAADGDSGDAEHDAAIELANLATGD